MIGQKSGAYGVEEPLEIQLADNRKDGREVSAQRRNGHGPAESGRTGGGGNRGAGAVIRRIQGLAVVFLFIAVWELLPRTGLVQAMFLSPASTVARTWVELMGSGELEKHILISMQRIGAGFGLSLAVVIPIGCLIGWYRSFERFVDPLIQAFRQTSALALFPVFILFFGIGEFSKIGMVFWAAQWPVLLGTISGIRNIDRTLVDVARTLGIGDFKLFVRIILPAAFPSIMTGIRLGAGASFLVLVAAEMIGAKSGLGFMIINAQYNFETPQMYAAIVTISLLGLAVNYLLVWIERKAMAWKYENTAH